LNQQQGIYQHSVTLGTAGYGAVLHGGSGHAVAQSGSVVSGTVSEIVVVSTDPGYLNDPGNRGTGTVVAILCHS
jgi:hypothetical protein